MFTMNGNEVIDPLDEVPEHPRQRAVNSLTELLAALTGRVANPEQVGMVVDCIADWCNYTTIANPIEIVPDEVKAKNKDKNGGQ